MPSCTEVRNPKAEGQKLTGRCAGHGGTIKPQRWSSPSPREGRAGRGVRSILNDAVEYLSGTPLSLALPMSFDSPASCRRFSLSPSEGERAGVRGPSWGSGEQSAPVCRGGLSPFLRRGEREHPSTTMVVRTRCAPSRPAVPGIIRPSDSGLPSAFGLRPSDFAPSTQSSLP